MNVADLVQFLTWRDAVDVLVVTVLVYNLLKLIRGTRAVQALVGVMVMLGLLYVANAVDLRAVQLILQGFLVFLPFAIVVLFQQQIRRALVNFGRGPLFGLSGAESDDSVIHELALAAETLGRRQVGGLIVVERGEGLRDYIENGIALDSKITFDLLLTIFTPTTPLHDGAVIVQGDRIAAAACFLPLSTNNEVSNELGTRHRAALGITEETDALAVVISEETGMVSVAIGGEMTFDLEHRALRNLLYRQLVGDPAPGSPVPASPSRRRLPLRRRTVS